MKKTEISTLSNRCKAFECRLGRIEYEPERVLTFAEGIYGFEKELNYVLWDDDRFLPFRWLICENNPDLMFPVLDPRLVVPEYAASDDSDMDSILAIVTLGGSDPVTINLRAPILFSSITRMGKQTILTDGELPLRYPVSR